MSLGKRSEAMGHLTTWSARRARAASGASDPQDVPEAPALNAERTSPRGGSIRARCSGGAAARRPSASRSAAASPRSASCAASRSTSSPRARRSRAARSSGSSRAPSTRSPTASCAASCAPSPTRSASTRDEAVVRMLGRARGRRRGAARGGGARAWRCSRAVLGRRAAARARARPAARDALGASSPPAVRPTTCSGATRSARSPSERRAAAPPPRRAATRARPNRAAAIRWSARACRGPAAENTHAVILRSVDFGESDRIVHLLVPEHGRAHRDREGRAPQHAALPGHARPVQPPARARSSAAARAIGAARAGACSCATTRRCARDAARFALGCYLLELLDRLAPEGGARRDIAAPVRFALDALAAIAAHRPDRRAARDPRAARARRARAAPRAAPLRRAAAASSRASSAVALPRRRTAGRCAARAPRGARGVVPVHLGHAARARARARARRCDRLDRLSCPPRALDEARTAPRPLPALPRRRRAAQPARSSSACSTSRVASTPGAARMTPARFRTLRPPWDARRGPCRAGAMTGDSAARARAAWKISSRCARGAASSSRRARSTAGSTASGTTGRSASSSSSNLKALWWQRVVRERDDVEGIDSAIIAHPRTWEASGHVEHFSDPMVDCRACKKRFRADQLDDVAPVHARARARRSTTSPSRATST